ncbi:hypothetical protein NPIL_697391 [Nephila pilipes]|uniref:Uncharacterized protein n=1 Tax=Nephila pilipes TaxID=299642 RepID=A0A8X6NH09_NEPPI|nr:hypothetical protein NPIL_697391 [Nephila pilipes]
MYGHPLLPRNVADPVSVRCEEGVTKDLSGAVSIWEHAGNGGSLWLSLPVLLMARKVWLIHFAYYCYPVEEPPSLPVFDGCAFLRFQCHPARGCLKHGTRASRRFSQSALGIYHRPEEILSAWLFTTLKMHHSLKPSGGTKVAPVMVRLVQKTLEIMYFLGKGKTLLKSHSV